MTPSVNCLDNCQNLSSLKDPNSSNKSEKIEKFSDNSELIFSNKLIIISEKIIKGLEIDKKTGKFANKKSQALFPRTVVDK